LPLFVYNLKLVARYGLAERARLDLTADHVGGENVHHLRRAQTLEDLQPKFLLPRVIGRGSQALAAAGADAQAAEIKLGFRVRYLQHLAVRGGGKSQDRDAMLLYGVEHLLRVELGDERSSRTETEGNSRITGVARPNRQGSGPPPPTSFSVTRQPYFPKPSGTISSSSTKWTVPFGRPVVPEVYISRP